MNANNELSPEKMREFFDNRAAGYDDHMAANVANFGEFYGAVAGLFPVTDDVVRVLDLGCGTGLELEFILQNCPDALVTGIDLSHKMLKKLKGKACLDQSRIDLIRGSYLSLPLDRRSFDYVVSVMTLHHLLPADKLELYRKIHRMLKPGGSYIEGDFVVSPSQETQLSIEYQQLGIEVSSLNGDYHLDIPMSVPTLRTLLKRAGFTMTEIIYQQGEAVVLQAGTVINE